MSKKNNLLHKLFHTTWTLFLSGLFTLLPFTITLALFNTSFQLIVTWLKPLRSLINPIILYKIPYAEIILVVIIIFIIGILYKIFIIRPIIHAIESLFFKIPLIRPIYSGVKQLVHSFSSHDKLTLNKVILVEFPRKGIYSLGFLTSELPPEITPNTSEQFFNIFIPTTPNPTSGFCIMVSENEFTIVDLTRQEAMAMIISGGIIQPDRFIKKQSHHTQ